MSSRFFRVTRFLSSSHRRIFWLFAALLASVLGIGLPLTVYTLLGHFHTVLYQQINQDNRSISHAFEMALNATHDQSLDTETWLHNLLSRIDHWIPAEQGYITLIDANATVRLAPHSIESANRERFNERELSLLPTDSHGETVSVSLRKILFDPERKEHAGLLRSENGNQIVNYRSVTLGGERWVIGVHQFESAIQQRLDTLAPYATVSGVLLFTAILLPFTLFTHRLIARFETEQDDAIAQFEQHMLEIEESTRQLRQTNEQLRISQEEKSQVYARISHDLRAPLHSILGSCSLVRDGSYGPVTDKQEHAMARVERNIKHLLRLIEQILQLARLESLEMTLRLETVDLSAFLEDLTDTIQPYAERKKIDLVCKRISSPAAIRTDREKLYLILQNLIGNAIQATDKGSVMVSAEIQGTSIAFSVQDTGAGIPREERDKIFMAFYQGRHLGGKRDGVGLGLTITKQLTHLLGGAISLQTAPGKGATFTVSFPNCVIGTAVAS